MTPVALRLTNTAPYIGETNIPAQSPNAMLDPADFPRKVGGVTMYGSYPYHQKALHMDTGKAM